MAGSAPDVPTLSDRELPQSIRNAAEDGDVDWFRALLDRHPGFHVNAAVGAFGYTALVVAGCFGSTEIVALLLDRGADLSKCDGSGWSPLTHAAYRGHTDTVELLLDRGADLDATTADDVAAGAPGKPVLSWAVQAGHTEVAGLLLGQGADLDKADSDGRTPLMGAARAGHPGCVKLLLVRGADFDVATNTGGHTALMAAALGGCQRCVGLLLSAGADPLARDNCERTAAILAQAQKKCAAAGLLCASATWPAFQTAVATRNHEVARASLRRGRISTAGCDLATLLSVGASATPIGVRMSDPVAGYLTDNPEVEVSDRTQALVRRAMSPWSPHTHDIFHPAFRSRIRALHMVAQRISDNNRRLATPRQRGLPTLPALVWTLMGTFLLRRD